MGALCYTLSRGLDFGSDGSKMSAVDKLLCYLLVLFGVPFSFGGKIYEHFGNVETLESDVVTLEVALDIGRVISFHRKGEPDWLVVFDKAPIPSWHWNPWGGDRVWPTAQFLHEQIYGNNGFDPVIDGAPWQLVLQTSDRLVMRSGLSPQLGVRVTRQIQLIEGEAAVVHTYWIERVAQSSYPVHIWAVTGIRRPDYVLMKSDPGKLHPGGHPYRLWPALYSEVPMGVSLLQDRTALQFAWEKDSRLKLGTYGGWIAAVSGQQAFCQWIDYSRGQLYLDGSNLQAFVDTHTRTFEIETLSPTWFLREGEHRQWTVHWEIIDFPEGVSTPQGQMEYLDSREMPVPKAGLGESALP
ncbi:MAG: hypothetical protein ACQKBT_03095 [Puniceicoccales bacterium]